MLFAALQQWHRRSLANSFALQASSIALLSVLVVAGVSLAIVRWTERQALQSELRHKGQAAVERLEDPIRVLESAVAELAKSPMITTALLDSGGRAAYARPFLRHYSFPVPAANGLALCDINGTRLAGTQDLSVCHQDAPEFSQVLADGKPRRTMMQTAEGRRLWTLFQGVTYAYTGTTEGVAVAQLDLEDLLRPLPAQLLLESAVLQASANAPEGHDDTLAVPLFKNKSGALSGPLELIVKAHPEPATGKLFPLLSGYLIATLLLLIAIVGYARRAARTLVDPLIALRDSAQNIAASGDLAYPIPVAGIDEVGQLAASLSQMVRTIHTAEATRREAEERFRMIFEKSDEAIFFGRPDGRIEAANPEACRLFGYSEQALCALGRSTIMDNADPRLPLALEERRHNGSFRGELRARRFDGTFFPVEVVSSLFLDEKGVARTSNLFRDITERKKIETALRDSEELITTVFDSLDEVIAVLDAQGSIVAVNESWRLFAQQNEASLAVRNGIGLNYLQACAITPGSANGEKADAAEVGIRRVLGGELPIFELEYACHSPSEQRWFLMRAFPLRGSQGGAVVMHENISRRKLIDRERSASLQKLSAMSHHLVTVQEEARRRLARELHDRTSPNLAAIGINLEVAELALQQEDWEAVAARMGDNSALISDTAASIREICTELRPPALDYAGLLPALHSYARQYSWRTGIALVIECPHGNIRQSPDLESMLFRIFQEALTNIVKHAQASTVNVTLSLDTSPVVLTVSDNGRGFDPESPAWLGRLSSLTGGQGILNMREMAEFAGGTFTLQSSPEQGTRIDVKI
jgi:PAS domain S-box-containing protein